MRRAVVVSWLSVLATAVAVAVAPSAVAGPVVSSLSAEGNYCVVNADTKKIACVDDEADLGLARSAVLGTKALAARSSTLSSSYLLGRFFDNANFNTSAGYIDFFGGAPCDGGLSPRDFGWSPMGGWANRISSFQGYSACFIRIWSSPGYTGSSLSYRPSEDNVGSMNDQTDSVEFS